MVKKVLFEVQLRISGKEGKSENTFLRGLRGILE